jgi:hypothetical protein
MCIEEMTELSKELLKSIRNHDSIECKERVTNEIADVYHKH